MIPGANPLSRRSMAFRRSWSSLAAGAALLVLAASAGHAATAASPSTQTAASLKGSTAAIAWQIAQQQADVDRAFATAKAQNKPVFMYWGAVWCPPCNQVKATLFSRSDFVQLTQSFVPIYVDGDKSGAQQIAARYKVSGYPTMVVFRPDGTELTRLPGEADPERYMNTMAMAAKATVPVKTLVTQALQKAALTPEQWRLVAFYSFDTDEQAVLAKADAVATLRALADAVPAAAELRDVRDRLRVRALAAEADTLDPAKDKAGAETRATALRGPLLDILRDPARSAVLADLWMNVGASLGKRLAPEAAAEREAYFAAWQQALDGAVAAPKASKGEQVDLWAVKVQLWQAGQPQGKLTAAQAQQVLQTMATVARQTPDRIERQSVIPSAAYVLALMGQFDASNQMLEAELPGAVAPYYHMLILASNAKKQGQKAAALQWYERAWKDSAGAATRIQWGTAYLQQLLELAPEDTARVAQGLQRFATELPPEADTFHARSQRSLQRLGTRLKTWAGTDAVRLAEVKAWQQKLDGVCKRVPARGDAQTQCRSLLG